MKGFARADLLIVLAIIAVVAGLFGTGLGKASREFVATYLQSKPAMPDLSKYPQNGDIRPIFCSETQIIARVFYNDPSTPDEYPEFVAFYATYADLKALRPYIVIQFEKEGPKIVALYLDHNRDGRADGVYTSVEELVREVPAYQSGPCGIYSPGSPSKPDA